MNLMYHPIQSRVYQGFVKGATQQPLIYGPNIKDWPEMNALTENILLVVAAKIMDPVTMTDELILPVKHRPFRSNPLRLAEFALSRRDPEYVGRSKAIAAMEQQRNARSSIAVIRRWKIFFTAATAAGRTYYR
jgi:aconitate hydratase